ncbi:hypothetical protein AVEN_22897-1 [Araneus ventricosus]|uniref:Uncharacterized protein n=1 Tax=Araneus ventricosus TaxID=182803 RepID=A0A4Y2D707_ARAVE|nr:hypothetical protein AVEN_22897-1 [Araneus ventricosus]
MIAKWQDELAKSVQSVQQVETGDSVEVFPYTECTAKVLRFLSKIEGGGWQATTDGISRGHKLSHEIKSVEIDPVVEAGGRSNAFPPKRMCTEEWRSIFSVSLENGGC